MIERWEKYLTFVRLAGARLIQTKESRKNYQLFAQNKVLSTGLSAK